MIETERLKLRLLEKDDLNSVFEIYSKDEITKPYGMYPIENIKKANKFLDTLMKDKEHGIVLKSTNKVIGTIGVVGVSEKNKRCEIGYVLLPEFWGKGYMTEAVNSFVRFLFNASDINRIETFIHPDNIASCKIVEKTGFVREGLLRQRGIVRGKFQDYYLYSILREDINNINGA
ncbi:GNAT family N-acetyltransferase [Clostridiaceae bacterium M8S5]|nr:GNAT family N-acetyltransferase [Clostridiaceae bacterium M8S5]